MHSSAGPERRRASCGLPALIEYFSGASPLSGQVAPLHQQSRDREYQGRQPGRAILRLEHCDQPATRRFYFGEQNFILALTTFPRTKCSSPAPHRSSPLFWRAVLDRTRYRLYRCLPNGLLPSTLPSGLLRAFILMLIAAHTAPHPARHAQQSPLWCLAGVLIVPRAILLQST